MKLIRVLDGLCFFLSPIAVLFFLLGFLMLNVTYWEHRNFVQELETAGYVTQGEITYVYEDADLLVEFVDYKERERSAIMDVHYYDAATLADITEGSQVDIRYVEYMVEPPVLEAHFAQVQAYEPAMGGLWFLFFLSWAIIIVRPDWLYTGFVDDPTTLIGFGPTSK